MRHHPTPAVLRCDLCGGSLADGIDEHGYTLCPRCAGRQAGYAEGESDALRTLLQAMVATARAEGLPECELRALLAP